VTSDKKGERYARKARKGQSEKRINMKGRKSL
jgi:hypothetical protein